MGQNQEAIKELWARLVTESQEDADLRRRMLDELAAVLKENGVEVPDGVSVVSYECEENTAVFPIPTKAADGELSEEQLAAVAGGIGPSPDGFDPSQSPDGFGPNPGPLGFDPVVE